MGMWKLDVEARIKDEQDFVQCSKLLANTALSGSVRALRLSVMLESTNYGHLTANNAIPVLLARLPHATRSLQVSTTEIRWTFEACQTLPLAPTLTQLWLNAGFKDDENGLEQLMARLPASLMDLSLRSWMIELTPLAAVIGTRLPPILTTLRLIRCKLTDSALTGFVWPKALRHLDLAGNHLTTVSAATLPAHLLTLGLQEIADMYDDDAAEWVAALLTTLRAINNSDTSLGEKFAAALLQRMPFPRATAAPMLVYVNDTALSGEGKKQLATKFTVIDAIVPF
ncbi:hypothetical protein GGF32_004367 [Allomyces javanicus]|nr:hypothetical protein GGF32_004367 [Allomyces javanicus]